MSTPAIGPRGTAVSANPKNNRWRPRLAGPILVHENHAQKIALANVAGQLMVSEWTLIRHFKKKLGMTPHTYLHNIRIDAAKALLNETSPPIHLFPIWL